MAKKNGDYTKKLISTCDDRLFMSSEIILEYQKSDKLGGIGLELDTQSGGRWAYLRSSEIQELINNLQTFLDRIKQDYP